MQKLFPCIIYRSVCFVEQYSESAYWQYFNLGCRSTFFNICIL